MQNVPYFKLHSRLVAEGDCLGQEGSCTDYQHVIVRGRRLALTSNGAFTIVIELVLHEAQNKTCQVSAAEAEQYVRLTLISQRPTLLEKGRWSAGNKTHRIPLTQEDEFKLELFGHGR